MVRLILRLWQCLKGLRIGEITEDTSGKVLRGKSQASFPERKFTAYWCLLSRILNHESKGSRAVEKLTSSIVMFAAWAPKIILITSVTMDIHRYKLQHTQNTESLSRR